jgi:hypothetical protein
MKEFCKREQSFSLSLYHQLVLREKRGNFFLFFIYKNHHSYLPWWRQENIFIISISTLSVSLQYTYLHHRSLRRITIFLVPLVILVCQVCPIKLLLLPHACVCLYFNNLIYNFHFSAANSIIIRPSIGDVRSWWSRRDVFVILQVEHDLPYNSNSLAIYSSLLQMMFWSFFFIAGSLTLNPLMHCFMMRETRWDSFICREMDIPLYILTPFLLQTLWLWMTSNSCVFI